MEANEAHELREHAEHGAHESEMRPVAFTMSVLAVLVAVTTVLGHRTHTEAVLQQNKATDQWNFYQAKKLRSTIADQASKQLSAVTVANAELAKKIIKDNTDYVSKLNADMKEEQEMAEAREKKVEAAEAKADRFDLGEALLEIGLVVTSVTLLTRRRAYWYFGMAFALAGILSSVSVLLLH